MNRGVRLCSASAPYFYSLHVMKCREKCRVTSEFCPCCPLIRLAERLFPALRGHVCTFERLIFWGGSSMNGERRGWADPEEGGPPVLQRKGFKLHGGGRRRAGQGCVMEERRGKKRWPRLSIKQQQQQKKITTMHIKCCIFDAHNSYLTKHSDAH